MSELNGIVENLDEAAYHAHPALSSTQARLLLETPADYRYAQKHPQPFKKAYDLGTLVHSKVLGTGAQIEVIPEKVLASNRALSTTAAKEFVAGARAKGLVPMKQEEAAEVDEMTESVLSHPTARILFEQEGHAESSVFATDPDTGVAMRARFDYLPNLVNRNPIAVDLKTTGKKASKHGFEKSVTDYGYDVQQAHYLYALGLATGVEIPMVFAVVETAPPYKVAVHQLSIRWTQMGAEKAQRARELLAECRASNVWPGYDPGVTLIDPPTYEVFRHEEKYA